MAQVHGALIGMKSEFVKEICETVRMENVENMMVLAKRIHYFENWFSLFLRDSVLDIRLTIDSSTYCPALLWPKRTHHTHSRCLPLLKRQKFNVSNKQAVNPKLPLSTLEHHL